MNSQYLSTDLYEGNGSIITVNLIDCFSINF